MLFFHQNCFIFDRIPCICCFSLYIFVHTIYLVCVTYIIRVLYARYFSLFIPKFPLFLTQFAKLKFFECNKMLFMCGASLIFLLLLLLGIYMDLLAVNIPNNFIADQQQQQHQHQPKLHFLKSWFLSRILTLKQHIYYMFPLNIHVYTHIYRSNCTLFSYLGLFCECTLQVCVRNCDVRNKRFIPHLFRKIQCVQFCFIHFCLCLRFAVSFSLF